MQQIEVASGFADAVIAAQSAFRTLMNAMARPGSIHDIASELVPPRGLTPAAAAFCLTLFDHDTPIWLDPQLRTSAVVPDWLRFHAGCPLSDDPMRAAFALIGDANLLPAFDEFALGTPDYPDRSTTLIVQVDTFSEGTPLRLSGPGILGAASARASPLPSDFSARCGANRALFPRGIDLILVAGAQVMALPRTTIVST